MNKTELLNYFSEARKIISVDGGAGASLLSKLDECEAEITDFSAKILFVGSFSAGKTALINTLLGEDELLRENITPETAIATEIIYGSTEKFIRVMENGKEKTYSLNDVKVLNIENVEGCRKYIYVLDNAALKEFPDFVFVDMPGFDSGIEAHNKALMQYIGDGAGYVFVIDIEKGTLSRSVLDFLREIKEYSSAIIFILTKKDKLPSSDVERVKNNIEAILKTALGYEPSLLATSSRDEDAGKQLAEFLRRFSADGLMMQKFGWKVTALFRQGINIMQTQLSALDFDPRELDKAIMYQERQQEAVQEEMKRAKRKLHNDFQTEVPLKILSDAEASLKTQLPSLVSAAKRGNQAFSAAINNILRPVLVNATQRYMGAGFENYAVSIEEAAISSNKVSPIDIDAEEVSVKLNAAMKSIGNIVEGGKELARRHKYEGVYKVLSTGLALTTNIVAPWLELIIIFLPDVIDLLNSLMGGPSKDEQISNSIEREIIPQICAKLQPDIQADLLAAEEEKSADIDAEFKAAFNAETEALQQLKAEKERKSLDVERRKAELAAGISRLQEIISAIKI